MIKLGTGGQNKDMTILWPKSKGTGIIVLDFIDEHNGYLKLMDNEYAQGLATYPQLKRPAREYLEYRESKEGYWTSEKFMAQIEHAVLIAEVKYPREKGYKLV